MTSETETNKNGPTEQKCNPGVLNNNNKADTGTDTPLYVINCEAEVLKPTFYHAFPNAALLKQRFPDKRVFGHSFEIYEHASNSNKFQQIDYSFRGIANHFISALHLCFMKHLPLQLRPDDIWLVIAQGFAAHISSADNAEKLRKKFVDFDGKKEILVIDNSLNINSQNNDWTGVLKQFSDGCRKLTNTDVVDLVTCDFSTTSLTSQTASQCVLFKALSKFISFHTMTRSGIPEIRLVGSVEDWAKLQLKVAQMAQMDIGLEFWSQHLVPVVDNIVKSVELLAKTGNGKLTKELASFWNSVYSYRSQSGGSSVSGWCKTLFPYLQSGKVNSELDWANAGFWSHVSPGDFPGSYSRCPMKWSYYDQKIKCGMYGGVFGIAQQAKTGCIAPVIGWVIGE